MSGEGGLPRLAEMAGTHKTEDEVRGVRAECTCWGTEAGQHGAVHQLPGA